MAKTCRLVNLPTFVEVHPFLKGLATVLSVSTHVVMAVLLDDEGQLPARIPNPVQDVTPNPPFAVAIPVYEANKRTTETWASV